MSDAPLPFVYQFAAGPFSLRMARFTLRYRITTDTAA